MTTLRAGMQRFVLLLVALTLIGSVPVHAQDLDTRLFGKLPVLDGGRIKPVEVFARAQMKNLSGTDKNATRRLITIIFDPARAEKMPILKITNPDVLSLLQINEQTSRLYSYHDVFTALDKNQDIILSLIKGNEENWTQAQRDLITLQEKTVRLQRLMSSLSAFLPLDIDPPRSYIDMAQDVQAIKGWVKRIVQDKGDDFSKYSEQEQKLARLSFLLDSLQKNGKNSDIFHVIPDGQGEHLSPWEAVLQNKSRPHLSKWKALADAYHAGESSTWNERVKEIYQAKQPLPLKIEYYYTLFNPFFISFLLCALALGALSIKRTQNYAFALLSLSVLIQILSIAARIYILARPPVSTLYETILFVCALAMLFCLTQRRHPFLWIAAGLGTILHILSFAHEGDGDTLLMLSAVLNTNFWLATHVLTITAGYAFCAITSILAHYLLLLRHNEALYNSMHKCALIALFFTTIGTVLGGIWADQSWGRFWGWDPKENGALLIVLWLIWVLHGRISGMMGQSGVLYGLAYLSVILAVSWFGVNLLSVGLHSYGFTDAAGIYLGAFIALETGLLGYIYYRRRQ